VTVERLIERLRRIPAEARGWDCDEQAARAEFDLDAALLGELVAQGLPHRGEQGALRFERGDLHCLSLHLNRATTYAWAAVRWARGLELLAARAASTATVSYVPQLPAGTAPGPGIALLPDGERRAVVLESGRAALTTRVRLPGGAPPLPPAAAHAVRDVAERIAFCPLPPSLRGDTAFAVRAGLSDCMTAAHLLVERWRTAGLEGRVVGGLLVSDPYSTLHVWAEVRADGAWLAADPLMLAVMCGAGGLDAARWPPERSVGAMLHRVEHPEEGLLTMAGDPVETSLLTVFLPVE